MQKAWAKAQAGRRLYPIADRLAQPLQNRDMRGVAFDIGEEADIVAGSDPTEMGFQRRGEARCGGFEGGGVARIGIEGKLAAVER